MKRFLLVIMGLLFFQSICFSNEKFDLKNTHEQAINLAKKLAEGRDVTLRILYPQGSELSVMAAGKVFEKETGIKIEYIESTIDDINTEIQTTSLLQSTHFDIALPATFGIPDLAESGAISNLNDLANRYEPNGFTDEFLYPIANFYKGDFYGYLADGDSYLAFYNGKMLYDPQEKEIFRKKYGKELKIPETWEELDQLAEFFYRPEQNMYGGSLYRTHNYIVWEFWMRFHSKGYYPLDENMRPQFNNAAGVQALEELIAVSKYLDPKVNSNEFIDNIQSFSEGNRLVDFGWGGPYKFFIGKESKIKDDLITAIPPGGNISGKVVRMPYNNWGWNYTISSYTDEKEIAYLYSLFATSPKGSVISISQGVGGGGFFDPYLKTHMDNPTIKTIYNQEFMKAQEFSLINGIPDLYIKGRDEYFNALKEGIMSAYLGKISSEKALNIIAKQWNLITKEKGLDEQKEQWQFLRKNYPSALKKVLK